MPEQAPETETVCPSAAAFLYSSAVLSVICPFSGLLFSVTRVPNGRAFLPFGTVVFFESQGHLFRRIYYFINPTAVKYARTITPRTIR